ncbi:MAG: hypothetical protein ACRDKB_09960 [Actinomycetota bacterium]
MKVIYVGSVGADDPTTASIPFHIAANGSVEVGQEAAVTLAGHAADLVVGDRWQSLEGIGVPPLSELVGKLRDHSVPIYV